MTDKDKIKKNLKRLKQYQNLSDEELDRLADEKIKKEELKNTFSGLMPEETKRAIELYSRYIEESSFESQAEVSSLRNLVYKEILKERIQEFIKKEGEDKKGAIPLAATEKLMELDVSIFQDKEKLGLLKDRNDESFTKTWNELKKKTLKYYEEHSGCNVIKCPHCQNLFMLLMKVDDLTPEKCNFFKGTLLYNKDLLDLYDAKKITAEEVAKVLGVNQKYVQMIYDNIYLKEKHVK